MKRSKRVILICMGVLIAAMLGYLFLGNDSGDELSAPPLKDNNKEQMADLTIEDINYVETKVVGTPC